MKRTAYMILATVALVLVSLVPAYAQKTAATVNIPFSFHGGRRPDARRRIPHHLAE